MHLKDLKKEQTKPQISRKKKIIKIREDVNETKTLKINIRKDE